MTGVAVNVTPVPEQTVLPGKAVMLTVGVTGDVTVMLTGTPTLVQPVMELVTCNSPLNVVVETTGGMPVMGMGLPGSAVKATSAKPAVLAALSQSILYRSGLPVIAV